MSLLTRYCILSLLWVALPVRAEDQHCMSGSVKYVSVEIGVDNAQRVMTYIRDEPGYRVNLDCSWILKPTSYENPRQMYIDVKSVDFDTNDVTEAQCNSFIGVDALAFILKRNKVEAEVQKCDRRESKSKAMQTLTEDKKLFKCTDKSFKVRKEIVNLWDPTYNLTLEFRSDNKQVRSDAKGVQVDVQVLGRDYCHRSMLFFEDSCFLVTEPLTPTEAFSTSKNFLGNVFTVPKNKDSLDFMRRFFQKNSDRASDFPFESPLNLAGNKMWTGYFIDLPVTKVNSVLYMNPINNCCDEERQLNVAVVNGISGDRCAVAVLWNSDGSQNFTCESMDQRLPAVIEFKQIPATKGDTHPQLFRTCDTLPQLLPDTTMVVQQSPKTPELESAPMRPEVTQPSEPLTLIFVFKILIPLLIIAFVISVSVISVRSAKAVSKKRDSLVARRAHESSGMPIHRFADNQMYSARSVYIV